MDVDNTLTHWGHLSQQKIDFIKTFAQKHRVILTTGKTYDSIKNVIDACHLQANYASCLNGSVLVENGKSTTLEKVGAISKQIVAHFDNAPFDTVVYYHDNIRLVKPLSQKSLDKVRTVGDFWTLNMVPSYQQLGRKYILFQSYNHKELNSGNME